MVWSVVRAGVFEIGGEVVEVYTTPAADFPGHRRWNCRRLPREYPQRRERKARNPSTKQGEKRVFVFPSLARRVFETTEKGAGKSGGRTSNNSIGAGVFGGGIRGQN